MMQANLNKIHQALSNLSTQKVLIATFIAAIFWNGLWGGFPRADHLIYLHQIGQYDDYLDIFLNSPSWNRTQSAGDAKLYRPLLYLQLGTFYYLFRYDFFLWQLASLVLHIAVVLGVHSLLTSGKLKGTLYPIVIALLFGSSLLGAELVLWNHISGYLTFSVFAIYSVIYLIRFLSTTKEIYGWFALLLGILAEFTYELGAVVNLLISASFLYKYLSTKNERSLLPSKSALKWALIFLGGAILYPALSIFDLWIRGMSTPYTDTSYTLFEAIKLSLKYALKQLVFWIGAWILPSAYDVHASGRASLAGFRFSGAEFLTNYTVVIGIFFTLMLGYSKEKYSSLVGNYRRWLGLSCAFLFLFAYSLIIAYGRALPRGLDYVFGSNLYYSYIVYLAIAVGVSLFMLDFPLGNRNADYPEENENIKPIKPFFDGTNKLLLALLSSLLLFNSYYTFNLASGYRYEFSPIRMELVDSIENWIKTSGKSDSAFFRVDDNCVSNDDLPWFSGGHFRKNSGYLPPAKLADVLFPDKSFTLNKDRIGTDVHSVHDIQCTQVVASSKMEEYGAEGLLVARNPGWHAASPVSYPQVLNVDFGRPRNIHQLLFLAQDGQSERGPKSIRVSVSIDATEWRDIYSGEVSCSKNTDRWNRIKVPVTEEYRYLRINILSNCGSNILTLRGLGFE